jgi:ribosome-associated toxin RatA of RatAB toxin-antitoxin module
MPIVEHTAEVDGAIEDVFDLSQSYALRLRWDPFVKGQRLLDGADRAGRDVRTETLSRHRLRMVTRYLTFRRPTLVGMKMEEGPWFFRTFSGSWRFEPLAPDRTAVAFRYNFACRPRALAPVAERIGRWYLGRDIRRRLAAFKAACDEGTLLREVRAERDGVVAEG